MVLVNPGAAVATPAVFRALECRDNPALPDLAVRFADADALVAWLAATRNDLEAPAIRVAPVIGEVLARLRATPGCRLARMSGSGATCFAIFADETAARAAAATLPADWWAAVGTV
jgi:4-diphosphocytidyl-2-C-methyl-D-erythritol kinase